MRAPLWPTVNAALNATSAVCLLLGYAFIKTRRTGGHIMAMMGACAASLGFFVSYICYHIRVGSMHFQGQGGWRTGYLLILASHTILAMVIVPLVARTLFLAARRQFDLHQRWARITLPLWLYVSVTGVVVYWMLYWWVPA